MTKSRQTRAAREFETTNSTHVIEAFHHTIDFSKQEWRDHGREARLEFPDVFESFSGQVSTDAVAVPDSLERQRIQQAAVVVLNEYRGPRPRWDRETSAHSLIAIDRRAQAPWSNFTLRRYESELELWLASDGAPRRGSYKLTDLRPGVVIRVRLNCRRTEHEGEPRYISHDCVIHHRGVFSRFDLVPAHELHTLKSVPLTQAKVIDLRAMLY
jgi:hypothetical protein